MRYPGYDSHRASLNSVSLVSRKSASCGLPVYSSQLSVVFINRLRNDSTLSSRWYTVAAVGIRNRDLAIASPTLYVYTAITVPYRFNAKKSSRCAKYRKLYVLVCPRYAEQHLT